MAGGEKHCICNKTIRKMSISIKNFNEHFMKFYSHNMIMNWAMRNQFHVDFFNNFIAKSDSQTIFIYSLHSSKIPFEILIPMDLPIKTLLKPSRFFWTGWNAYFLWFSAQIASHVIASLLRFSFALRQTGFETMIV